MKKESIKDMLRTLWFNIIALNEEKEESNKKQIRKNIKLEFELLDEKMVPFIIQNKVIELAQRGRSFDSNINNILEV